MGRMRESVAGMGELMSRSPILPDKPLSVSGEQVSVASTAALLNLLADFTEKASNVLQGIFDESEAAQQRIEALQARAQRADGVLGKLEAERASLVRGDHPQIETLGQEVDLVFPERTGILPIVSWSSDPSAPQPPNQPMWAVPTQSLLNSCDPEHPFELLDGYTEDQEPGGCRRKYTDPYFFVEQWTKEMIQKLEAKRQLKKQQKAQKAKRKGGAKQSDKAEKQELKKKVFKVADDFSDLVPKVQALKTERAQAPKERLYTVPDCLKEPNGLEDVAHVPLPVRRNLTNLQATQVPSVTEIPQPPGSWQPPQPPPPKTQGSEVSSKMDSYQEES
eukprot:CAMPEP_0184305576 /NCGR_PEP_ID=MMETSP1049-20130417/14810_1 /TAXON_ID=77928 /ORGANISM="Proteomonas sulcata, Strain CCMP704" /LENGTH=333 /DNA_ID=CAMNT_0026617679 /DNA_START=46 /DNA_END=1044 /DNA_ORIENTATION=-